MQILNYVDVHMFAFCCFCFLVLVNSLKHIYSLKEIVVVQYAFDV